MIGRFTQEDTYRGDGLNLYAYCANNPVYYVDPSGNYSECMKEAYLKARRNGMSKEDTYAYAKKVYKQIHEAKANTPDNKGKNINKYPPRTPLAEAECQRVVDMGNKIKLNDQMIVDYQATRKTPFSPVTCVFVHEDGTVSVGISGYDKGTRYTRHYANELQKALNKSAGYKKYTVSATTASDLMNKMPDDVDGGNFRGACAEPKAATAAHENKSPIVGMDVRYYTSEGSVPHALYEGTNQMDQCNTCKHYEEVIMEYANENENL